jgi:hypothetical protein
MTAETMMLWLTSIQMLAVIIQASAAIAFLRSVRRDARLREHARQEAIVEKLLQRWNLNPDNATLAERTGFPLSDRQHEAFNRILAEAGCNPASRTARVASQPGALTSNVDTCSRRAGTGVLSRGAGQWVLVWPLGMVASCIVSAMPLPVRACPSAGGR